MSKRNKERKIQKEQNKLLRGYKDLIHDLLFGLDEYNVSFEIIESDRVFKDSDYEFLSCPFAVQYKIHDYKGKMYINENGTGFYAIINNKAVDIDNPAWFFVGYSQYLEKMLNNIEKC